MPEHRHYSYVGHTGTRITSHGDLRAWLKRSRADADDRGVIIATFVIAVDGTLVIAHRHFEHVKCAGAAPVLSAGEMSFADGAVVAVSNQSTGYCPEPESWPAVAEALDRAGIEHPGCFTTPILFRRCPNPTCGQRNIVKDGDFRCGVCEAELPQTWNFEPK